MVNSCYPPISVSHRGDSLPVSPRPSWSYGTNYYGAVVDDEHIPWEANGDEGGYNGDLLLAAYIGRIRDSADGAAAKEQARRLALYVIEQIVVIDGMSWVSSESQRVWKGQRTLHCSLEAKNRHKN